MKKPLLSVLMPVYNGEKFLKRAVESVLSQTFKPFEFVIVNDGSTDASGRILRAYARKDKKIHLIQNPENLGLVKTLNKGLNTAKAWWIARFDCDDYCYPQRLEKQFSYMREHPDCVITGTQANWVNDKGDIIWKSQCPVENRDIRKAFFCFTTAIQHTTAMYVKIKGLEYRESTYPAEDYDYFLRLLEHGKAHVLPEYLVDYYLNSGGITTTNKMRQVRAIIEGRKLLLERIRYKREVHPPPDLKKMGGLQWRIINRLFSMKSANKNRFVRYFLTCCMLVLSPAWFLQRYFWKWATKYVHAREYKQFIGAGS